MARVLLAMSGGVDSSVAAHLLQEQNHEVIGVFMRHGEEAVEVCSIDGKKENSPLLPIYQERMDHKQGCCSAADAEDARRVAENLDIPFYALNLQREFGDIIDYFVDEYSNGRTPNPCVMCNNHLKFGKLFDYADSVGAEFVATGHYARIGESTDGYPNLLRGIDDSKDQSYVLFGIRRELFSRMLLPVGQYEKPKIRELASKVGLRVAEKKDSQEICFVTSGKHGEFVRQRRGAEETSGDIVTVDGKVVGTHPGIEQFTIGQRRGIKVAMGEPYFVVKIDAVKKQVVIGPIDALGEKYLIGDRLNWIVDPPSGPFSCEVQIRYNSPPQPATAEVLSDNRLSVEFIKPVNGVAPGQAVVCYQGDRVLGGGWIVSAGKASE